MTLGLFPLNLVLLPSAQLPLHIFEPRYKQLIGECLHDGRAFGINLVEGTHMHGVGCTATVVKLLQRYPDGRMDVIVQGDRRYRVTDVHTSVAPYVVGDVEEIEDDDVPIDILLLRECADLFSTLLSLVYPDRDRMAIEEYFDSSHHVSYIMALKAGLDAKQKQHLLELSDENERILYLRDHMKTLIPSIERDQLVQRVIANDGYIVPGRSK